ncbi:hypothetical protein D3C72_820360 [compost metagenome]
MVHQFVVGGAQFRVAGVLAQARTVDQRLRVLDAETHRERLGFHEHATAVKHAEGVAGAVAEGQDHVFGVDLFAAIEFDADQLAVFDQHVGDALLEAHFTAQGANLLTHVFHHAGQTERTDVRFADVEDFFRSTGLDEFVQDFTAEEFRVLDLAVELAVGECPRAAFTELHVGLGVEHAFAPQAPGVLGALAYFGAAFEDDRLEAHLRQQQPGENPARAEADDDRPHAQIGRRLADFLVADIRRHVDVTVIGKLVQYRRLIANFKVDGVDEAQFGGLFTRIVAALEQGEIEQIIAGKP